MTANIHRPLPATAQQVAHGSVFLRLFRELLCIVSLFPPSRGCQCSSFINFVGGLSFNCLAWFFIFVFSLTLEAPHRACQVSYFFLVSDLVCPAMPRLAPVGAASTGFSTDLQVWCAHAPCLPGTLRGPQRQSAPAWTLGLEAAPIINEHSGGPVTHRGLDFLVFPCHQGHCPSYPRLFLSASRLTVL